MISDSEFDALAAAVSAGELSESDVIKRMSAEGWPGHSPLECVAWWESEYAARRAPGPEAT